MTSLLEDIAEGIATIGRTVAEAKAQEAVNEQPRPTQEDSGFRFGASSRKHMEGVHPDLIAMAELALKYSRIDMTVLKDGGMRTEADQRKLVNRGVSKTMRSKHRPIWGTPYAHAIDLNAWKNGAVSWDWNDYYLIAMAVDRAATELGMADRVRWGGAWDRTLADFGGNASAYAREVQLYRTRTGKGFIDGPHFELVG